MPSPSTRSTLFSKFEKLLPSQRKSPRSCKNSTTLSWWGSISGSLQAAKLLLATFLTYLKRRVFLNGAFDAFGRKSVNIKVIAIRQTRPTNTIRWLCSRILHGILILFMCIHHINLRRVDRRNFKNRTAWFRYRRFSCMKTKSQFWQEQIKGLTSNIIWSPISEYQMTSLCGPETIRGTQRLFS